MAPLRVAFERNGKSAKISWMRVMVNDPISPCGGGRGLGVAYTIEALAEPFLRSGSWCVCWRTGRRPSRDCFCIIPATGRGSARCALSSI